MKRWLARVGLGVGLGAALAGGLGAAESKNIGGVVGLRESVQVRSDRVRLADLLPADVGQALRKQAAAIELGRGPQLGSMRVFEREQIEERLRGYPKLLEQVGVPERVVVQRAGWPIARSAMQAAISNFMQSHRENGEPGAVWLGSSKPVAAGENPALEVVGMNWNPAQRLLEFRLRCLARELCGTFLVAAEVRGGEFFSAAKTRAERALEVQAELVRAGKPAQLVVEGPGVRITLPVICLEAGALKQRIRVLDQAHHRVLHAEVEGEGRVRGTF